MKLMELKNNVNPCAIETIISKPIDMTEINLAQHDYLCFYTLQGKMLLANW